MERNELGAKRHRGVSGTDRQCLRPLAVEESAGPSVPWAVRLLCVSEAVTLAGRSGVCALAHRSSGVGVGSGVADIIRDYGVADV